MKKSHNHVALECFNYGHTLALLPLNGNVSSVVLTVSTDNSKEMLSLSENKFNEMATEGFKQKLGQMKTDRGAPFLPSYWSLCTKNLKLKDLLL